MSIPAIAHAMAETASTGISANRLLIPENMPPPSSTMNSAHTRPHTVIAAGIHHQAKVSVKVIV